MSARPTVILPDNNDGGNATAFDGVPQTPRNIKIHTCAANGDYQAVLDLLAKSGGEDVNCRDRYGRTLLQVAAKAGETTLVAYLLSLGANPIARGRFGTTPLGWAAYKSGFGTTHESEFDQALGLATSNDHFATVRLLLSHPDVHAQVMTTGEEIKPEERGLDVGPESSGSQPLAVSVLTNVVHAGNVRLARLCLTLGIGSNDPEVLARLLTIPSLNPVIREEIAKAQLFLAGESHADLTVDINDAVTRHDVYTVRRLLEWENAVGERVDVDTREAETGHTPLMKASMNGSSNLVALLLQHGANPALQSYDDGSTAFMLAVRNGHFEAARLLLSHPSIHSASWVNATTPRDTTDLDGVEDFLGRMFATTPQSARVSSSLPAVTAVEGEELSGRAAAKRLAEAVQSGTIIAPGVLVQQDNEGNTPLHVALRNGHRSIIKLILAFARYRATYAVHIRNYDDESPLAIATGGNKTLIEDFIARVEGEVGPIELPEEFLLPPCVVCRLSPEFRPQIAYNCSDCDGLYCEDCMSHLGLSCVSAGEIPACQANSCASRPAIPMEVLSNYLDTHQLVSIVSMKVNSGLSIEATNVSSCISCHRSNDMAPMGANGARLACTHCGCNYCVICQNVYPDTEDDHAVHANCNQKFIGLRVFAEFKDMVELKGQRRCPNCPQQIGLKDTSCSHMTCDLCRARWCWVCGKSTAMLGISDIYDHGVSSTDWQDDRRKCPMYISRLEQRMPRVAAAHCPNHEPNTIDNGCDRCRIIKDAYASALIGTIRVRYHVLQTVERIGKQTFIDMVKMFHWEEVINTNYFGGEFPWEGDEVPHYLDFEPEADRPYLAVREHWFSDGPHPADNVAP